MSYLFVFVWADKLGSYVFLKTSKVADAGNTNAFEAKVGLSEVQSQPELGQPKL